MTAKLALCLVALCLRSSPVSSQSADANVADYIYWKKEDINAWHQFFPSRRLEEERLTNLAAVNAISSLASGLGESLSKVVEFQAQELINAQQLMAGTDAEGCVNGISDYMTTAISNEISNYNDCTADALLKMNRLNKSLANIKANYLNAYQKALVRIDACAKTYPNKDSLDRLKSCVTAMNTNYYTVANGTLKAVFPSPSMKYFQSVVVDCISDAAIAVASKGTKFLEKLLECSALDSDIDPTSYAQQLSQWKGYNDTLAAQILTAQNKNYNQVRAVEDQMTSYYNFQKETLEKYVFESRGLGFYMSRMYSYLSVYYNNVTASSVDNPEDAANCVNDANAQLQEVVSSTAYKSLSCDLNVVSNTKVVMSQIAGDYAYLNSMMPSIGNAALLNCIARGYVYAPNTIGNCFNLDSWQFDILFSDRNTDTTTNVGVLTNYEQSFFSGTDLPCGGSTLQAAYLSANVVLYNLQRCLYITSGTDYSVTTTDGTTATTRYTSTISSYQSESRTTTISTPLSTTTAPSNPISTTESTISSEVSTTTIYTPSSTTTEPSNSVLSTEATTSFEPSTTIPSSESSETILTITSTSSPREIF